ncbi:MAG: prolipoprotein diacylglyceryl transferase [Anaerolineae bacterium]|nr:prolipoprotein diacylglyceryl transferase [Anaerolineae bacterium]
MLNFYTYIGSLRLQTYTLLLGLGIVIVAISGLYRQRAQAGRFADVYLGALIGGVVGARGLHVLLNWRHFAYTPEEILQFSSGGLDWHGAVWGGLIGLVLMARWRRVNVVTLLESLTLAVPLLAIAGWMGCWAAGCAYGAEVDTLARYSPLLVSESPDVYGIPAPRYRTHLFGVVVGLLLLILAGVMLRRGWLPNSRFWILLVLLSAGMLMIGFFRADYALMARGLRADQWLDGLMLGFGLINLARVRDAT